MFFDFLFAMLLPKYLTNSNSSIVSGDENEDDDDVGDYDDDYDDEIRNEDENDGDDDNVEEEEKQNNGENYFDFLSALCAFSQKSLRVREKIARTDLVYCHSYSPGFHKFSGVVENF